MISENLQSILYVDDDPDMLALTRIAFSTVSKMKMDVCSSGHEALEKAGEISHDLLMLDVDMPGLDGPSTLRELRKLPLTATTPVIFFTANVQQQDLALYASLGVIGIIAKPVHSLLDLPQHVTQMWEERR